MKHKLFYTMTIIVMSIGAIFVLPALMTDNSLSSICSLPRANAQDSPCLAQEATISALQVEVLQAQATNVALQSTVVALESQTSTNAGGATAIPAVGLPYEDDFSTNRGYELIADADGSIRLSQGQILISANKGKVKSLLIPGLTVGDNFYVQVDITPRYSSSVAYSGILLCDNEANTACHLFYLFDSTFGDVWIGIDDQGTNLFSTLYSRLVGDDQTFTLGVEANNGSYTIYVNGAATETSNLNPYGGTLGLIVGSQGAQPQAFFDNLLVRETR